MYSWGTNKEQIYPLTELQLNRTIHSGVTEIFRSLKFMSKLSNSPSPTVIFPAPQKFTSAIGIFQDILPNTHHWLFRWVQLLASPVVRSRRRRPTIRIRLRCTGLRPRTNRSGRTASSWPVRSGRPQDGGQPLRSAQVKRGRIGIDTVDLQQKGWTPAVWKVRQFKVTLRSQYSSSAMVRLVLREQYGTQKRYNNLQNSF